MQNLMGCHEIEGGLKGNCIIKSICLKNITGDQSYIYISLLYFCTPLLSTKSSVNKHVKSQDALTISSNLAKSSALVEAI
jgi:hypothetical protein